MCKKYLFYTTSWMVLIFLSLSLTTHTARAATITSDVIEKQRYAVRYEQLVTMREELKLIQMLYIQHLQERIDALQQLVM